VLIKDLLLLAFWTSITAFVSTNMWIFYLPTAVFKCC